MHVGFQFLMDATGLHFHWEICNRLLQFSVSHAVRSTRKKLKWVLAETRRIREESTVPRNATFKQETTKVNRISVVFVLLKTIVQIIRYANYSPHRFFLTFCWSKIFVIIKAFLLIILIVTVSGSKGSKERITFCVVKQGNVPDLYFFRHDNDSDDNNW